MKKQSFKYSLLGFIGLIIILMGLINIYSMLAIRSIEVQYSNMIEKMLAINNIGNDINLSVFYFDKYFDTKSTNDLKNYEKYYYDSQNKLKGLDIYLNDEISADYKDLKNVIENYHSKGEIAVYKFTTFGRNEECYKLFVDTKLIASYSGEYVKRLNDSYLKYNDIVYKDLKARTRTSRIIVFLFFGFITLFCIVFSAVFSKMITVPIAELAASAEKLSKGNFDIGNMNYSGMYEIDVLSLGFNRMASDIRELINKMREKADVEKKLSEQEMKNLLVENMLREAQLKALQSQINPHFLFNTLNTVVQTSIIEGAGETERLINAVSELLRYSLNMIDRQSRISAEISVIKEYIYIQETRFKDRVKFSVEVDNSMNSVEIPGMTLQPIVENAFIHGIEGREEGGKIDISVCQENDKCIIKVEDNGVGMTQERIEKILKCESNSGHGHTTGIGVRNVIKRLRIMYPEEEVFNIESRVGIGTIVYIKIPLKREWQNV